jgi:membrane protein YdbS with pleckstrin-like domain
MCIFVGCLSVSFGYLLTGYLVPDKPLGIAIPVMSFQVAYYGIALLIFYLVFKYTGWKYKFTYEYEVEK